MSHLMHRAIAVVLLLAAVPAFAQEAADIGAKDTRDASAGRKGISADHS